MTRARDLADFNLDGKAVTINESSADLDFRVESNGNANMLFVDGGNDVVGIKVVPSAWSADSGVIQVGNSSVANFSNGAYFTANSFFDGSNNRYIASDEASRYYQASGIHIWQTAAAGTAGDAVSFSEKMRLDSSGNLLVGTTTEGIADYGDTLTIADTGHAGMTIRSGTSSEGNVYFSDGTSGDAEYKGIVKYDHSGNEMSFWSNSLRRITIDSSGNVGIGTAAPASLLHLDQGSGGEGLRFERDSYDTMDIELSESGFRIRNETDGRTDLFIDGSGNVGIGTSSPGALLDIESTGPSIHLNDSNGVLGGAITSSVLMQASGSTHGTVGFGTSGGNMQVSNSQGNLYLQADTGGSHSSSAVIFTVDNSEKMRLNSSGHLQIGQTASNTPGSGNTTAGSALRSVGDAYFSRDGDIALYLSRNGSDGKIASFARGGGEVGSISVASSSTSYTTSSDRRLKSNIEDAASASDKIDAIQVRQFDWNVDDSHQDYGLIAQELQPIEPLAVTGDADSDEMMAVDYSKLVPMLIKEIQELRSRVATLEAS